MRRKEDKEGEASNSLHPLPQTSSHLTCKNNVNGLKWPILLRKPKSFCGQCAHNPLSLKLSLHCRSPLQYPECGIRKRGNTPLSHPVKTLARRENCKFNSHPKPQSTPYLSLLFTLSCFIRVTAAYFPLLFTLSCFIHVTAPCLPLPFTLSCFVHVTALCLPLLFTLYCFIHVTALCLPLLFTLYCFIHVTALCLPLLFTLYCFIHVTALCLPLLCTLYCFIHVTAPCLSLLFTLLCFIHVTATNFQSLFPLSCYINVTAVAEMKVPSSENPELSKVLSVKPGLGQNIALYVSLTARNSTFSILPSWFGKWPVPYPHPTPHPTPVQIFFKHKVTRDK